ncbi:MAG: archease [Gammaproteobacteria bacterium]|nr:archease [Gammaproteobacteria bacterium]NIR88949.1 archease [Gammaproteobacteria bacterium]NIU05238.1 archease [Gammaproteobacteria bacterium]NIV52853.1 archease [Gammaproteobacteria bacterium]NIW85149.1 archease [Gammaproteobacteria bacterium]
MCAAPCEPSPGPESEPASGAWEHFHHVADIGVRGYGVTLDEAFANAATALTAVIIDPRDVAPAGAVEIHCESPDEELLLYDWLNALVYEMATRRMLFGRFEVRIMDGHCLEGIAWGEDLDPDRHHPVVEVKGATCTELKVGRARDGRWMAQAVVDV